MQSRDRGTIKWTSLMLPEHVEMIKKVWKEDERVEKGILDEQKAAEIDFVLQRALHDRLTVDLRVHNGFDYDVWRLKITDVNKRERKVETVLFDSKEERIFRLDEVSDITIV
ncbi:YolD-like family protein [Halobacillus sp. Marseille-Q1614]|uniref:YolD-like family protein n=1 Tax=Halobacillus sp. Marseille-Q1614 TaxID=2709134 RepID=UPI0020C220CB|nr:YolD-like family protein [Halobacillus sp. Marseille-Q1614]